MNLPLDPYEDPLLRRVPLEPTGGLAGIEVAALENGGKPLGLPRLAVVRVTNAAGRPLTALDLGVYALENGAFGAAPLATIRTNDAGIALVPATLLGSPLLAFVGEANGEREVAFLKLSQLQSAAARGNDAAPIFDLRLNLPTLPVSREASLAAGKILTDSLGTPSSSLAAIADDNPGTGWRATYPPGSWIEVDLGRDRTIAEVGLLGGLPKSFDLRLRGTGEDPSSATRWASEGDWAVDAREPPRWRGGRDLPRHRRTGPLPPRRPARGRGGGPQGAPGVRGEDQFAVIRRQDSGGEMNACILTPASCVLRYGLIPAPGWKLLMSSAVSALPLRPQTHFHRMRTGPLTPSFATGPWVSIWVGRPWRSLMWTA